MSKTVKDMVTEDYRGRYADVQNACVVDVTRLNVKEATRLREDLRAKNMRLQVVKNSLARRALAGTTLEPLGAALTGPCALVTGGDSIIDVARLLIEARKTFAQLELKQAIFEGDENLLTVEDLSKMRGRKEVLGEAAMLISSPGRALSGCLRSPGGKLAGCLKTLSEKAEAQAA